jgi:hypothetical protein
MFRRGSFAGIWPGRRLEDEVRRLQEENCRLESLVRKLQPPDRGVVFDPFHPSIECAAAESGYQYFLVTSWGHSGSIWYAGSLNLHEAVFCNVGAHHPIQSFKAYWLNVGYGPFVERATVHSFRFGANIPNPMSDGSPVPKFDLPPLDIPRRDMARLPWFVFDEMDDMVDMITGSKPRFVGSVHGLWLPPLAEALHSDPSAFKHRRFPMLNLIRHPVGRTESAIAAVQYYLMLDLKADIDRLIDEQIDEVRRLEKTYKVDFSDPRARAVLHVFRQGHQNLTWVQELIDYPRVKHIKMELLQGDRDYFAAAFNDLTSGRILADNAYLDEVFKPENLGSGRQQRHLKIPARPAGPRDQFNLWSDFERAEFRRVAEQRNLRVVYAAHDYDLSFV